MIGTILAWLWSMRQKIKWMDFTFPFQMTLIVTWRIWKQILLSCEFQVSEIIKQSQAFVPDYYHMDNIHLRWYSFNMMRWNILSVRLMKYNQCSPPSYIRKSNVALMLWYGEKSDLALGSGMFLLKLWWEGPGRGHMKGSLCQAAKMFSLSLMKTRTHGQTREHACHTLYKH